MAHDLTAALFSGDELLGRGPAPFVREAQPDVVAGHGLGDLAALVAADALDLGDALRLAVVREQLVAHASEHAGGGLLALACDDAALKAALVAERSGAHLARYDSPSRCVMAGSHEQLSVARNVATELGIATSPVQCAGALHCCEMAATADIFGLLLHAVPFRRPAIPVYCAVTAEPIGDPRHALMLGLIAPVRWSDTIHELEAAGVTRFVESGGHRLGDLVCETLDELVHA